MASSSSNTTAKTSRPTTEYFFYGTHPLKVPSSMSHSHSAQNVLSNSEQRTYYTSLPANNHHNGCSPTTHSLNDFPTSAREEDEISEIFEDAVENFDDIAQNQRAERRPSSKHHETPALDLPQVFFECEQITELFLGNQLNEAFARAKAQENRSFYHGLCSGTIHFVRATMTFNPSDIEIAMQGARHTITMTKKFEQYRSWVPFNLSAKPATTEHELHAKLVYAEALLIQAFLSFIQDQSILSFISGALKIKECHSIYGKLAKQCDPSKFSSDVSYEHFDSGVRLGNGAFNLIISNMPQRIIKYLEFAGFSGNRDVGLTELYKSATSKGLRASSAALLLLCYHTFVTQIFGNSDGDLETCQRLVDDYLRRYPNSYILLVFQARLQAIHYRLDEAISSYQFAIQSQTDWKDLHNIAHWEILSCNILDQRWPEAAAMAKILLNENNWSKATYCYILATCLYEDNNRVVTDEIIQLYKRVPELKIRLAGKSIPLEKFAIKRCEHFFAQECLFMPGLELVYLLNGFYTLAHDTNKLSAILDTINNAFHDLELNHQNDRYYTDCYGLGLLIRGVVLHFLHQYDEAQSALNEIIYLVKKFDKKSYLAANATLEKALIYIRLKQKQKAIDCLHKALNDYKDYHLESRLQFRINAAMQSAKQLDN